MTTLGAFWFGLLGALFIYAVRFRQQRLKTVIESPRQNWRVLVFDMGIFLFLGGMCVAFLIQPDSTREAFLGGATWEAFVTNVIPTKE